MRRAVRGMWLVGGLVAPLGAAAQGVRTSISGTVYDSVAKRHLDSAVVQLVRAERPGEGRSATADANGRFRFDDVPEGNWILGFIHPVLDSLGLRTPLVQVLVRDPQPIRAVLAVPAAATIVRSVCGFPVDSGGLWYGYTRSAVTGDVVPGATVQAAWSRIRVMGTSLQRDTPNVTGTSGEQGAFHQCWMPTDDIVLAKAWHEADSSGVMTFTMPAAGLLRRDIFIGPVEVVDARIATDSGGTDTITIQRRTGTGRLVGRVLRSDGEPLRGARLRFVETGQEALSNDKGQFVLDSLPLGSYSVDARAIGFVSALRPIDIVAGAPASAHFVLDTREAFLDTVKVIGRAVAMSQQHLEFLRRKRQGLGRFFDEDDIEKRNPFYVSDLLRMTAGVRILTGGRVLFRAFSGLGQYCTPSLYLDGMQVTGIEEMGLDAFLSVHDIRAMEVYTRGAQVPAQFARDVGCGALVVWTGPRTRNTLR
ncbi:MAG: carboxypeptidase regulatory-like domain-containing protein [Cytophagaceae bacterium]|nr:carboxypeptidase regulatory-like domain-containing protein [Gemmatimonadaceae bacterium]